ncbi:MAG: peroxiredoxin [Candidatus Micrarchaeota archaeon]|nr:peroxiredoxin [Candidatus Micrarchaeota archaeon]
MIAVNDKAPDFSLEGSDGKKHSLGEFRGRYLVLYFYPKDDTPGCTVEACGFRDMIGEIKKTGAEVVGISKDGLGSHGKFRAKYRLNFLLLSDPASKTIKAYDSYGDRGIFGMGTLRKTYIIDKKGKIAKVFERVKPEGHNKEVLEFLKEAKAA